MSNVESSVSIDPDQLTIDEWEDDDHDDNDNDDESDVVVEIPDA
jgi:hypothetical protein